MLRARGTQAFFAALTHELRTPLTSVRLQTEAIAAGEPTQELIERLLADTHRLESQIDKTLELARLEGGGSLAEQAIRLDPWLERVLRRHRWRAKENGAQLNITRRSRTCRRCSGDTSALQLILRNLVENSLRHGDARDRASTSRSTSRAAARAWRCAIATTAAASTAIRRSSAACSSAAARRAAPAWACIWCAC